MKTVNHHEFTKALYETQRAFEDEVGKENARRITISEMPTYGEEPVHLGVNWAAIGQVDADKALEFSSALLLAAKTAQAFKYNGYVITFD